MFPLIDEYLHTSQGKALVIMIMEQADRPDSVRDFDAGVAEVKSEIDEFYRKNSEK